MSTIADVPKAERGLEQPVTPGDSWEMRGAQIDFEIAMTQLWGYSLGIAVNVAGIVYWPLHMCCHDVDGY